MFSFKRCMYAVLKFFIDFCLSLFYSRISVKGAENIPTEGAVVLAGTHFNGLIDPAIIVVNIKRQVTAIAAGYLFDMPVLGTILRLVDAIPVIRRSENQGKRADNSGAIGAMVRVLEMGRCLCIFPEGVSHNDSEILELKVGFAKAAFGALANGAETVAVVPVGLNYEDKNRFASQVFISFDAPIVLDSTWLNRYKADEKKAIDDLRNLLRERLSSVTITAPSADFIRVAHLARQLYKEDNTKMTHEAYVDFTIRFLSAFRDTSDDSVKKVIDDLRVYREQLDILGLEDYHLSMHVNLFHTMTLALLAAPFIIPGSLFHGPMGLVASFLGKKLGGGYKDQEAHYKIMVLMLLVPLCYLVMGLLLTVLYGLHVAYLVLSLLLISAVVVIRIRPLTNIKRILMSFIRLMVADTNILKEKRSRLQREVRELMVQYGVVTPTMHQALRPQSFRIRNGPQS